MKCGWLYVLIMFHEATAAANPLVLLPVLVIISLARILLIFGTDLRYTGLMGDSEDPYKNEVAATHKNMTFQTFSSGRLNIQHISATIWYKHPLWDPTLSWLVPRSKVKAMWGILCIFLSRIALFHERIREIFSKINIPYRTTQISIIEVKHQGQMAILVNYMFCFISSPICFLMWENVVFYQRDFSQPKRLVLR